MRNIIFYILLLTTATLLHGQKGVNTTRNIDALTSLKEKELNGDIVLNIDSLVLVNYNKHLIQNSKNIGIEGYRIRIFSDNGYGAKEMQMRVMANFLSFHPEIRTEPKYEGSYYKVYVGDFRTKRDALKILDTIRKNFPDAFIVEDKIVIEE